MSYPARTFARPLAATLMTTLLAACGGGDKVPGLNQHAAATGL